MRVYHSKPGESGFRPLPGPGELRKLTGGKVRVIREESDHDNVPGLWADALGLFVLRGGTAVGVRGSSS